MSVKICIGANDLIYKTDNYCAMRLIITSVTVDDGLSLTGFVQLVNETAHLDDGVVNFASWWKEETHQT